MAKRYEQEPYVDTYAILEFQGYVSKVPTFDKLYKRLEFECEPLTRRYSLRFFCEGELAKAFKSLLTRGCLVQVRASPRQRVERIGERCYAVVEWEAKLLQLLGYRKFDVRKYADLRVLDGLMPVDDEIHDVGFVDPVTFERYLKFREDAANELKRRGEAEEANDDKDLQRPIDSGGQGSSQ